MKCPDCDGPTKVLNSRHVDSPIKNTTRLERDTAERLVGWYTSDWIVRKRACQLCRKRLYSIELYGADFDAIIKERKSND